MRYGHFDDERREYVVEHPDTPLPWVNYLGTEAYFGIISNTAGGYSFYRDARLRRLTRYRYNAAPFDIGGRYLYLRDDRSGEYWSSSWQPTQVPLDAYECRHGLSYTVISSSYRGVDAETLYYVPLGEALEVWRLRITNCREEAVELLDLLVGRVLPLGCRGRRHELPAQPVHRSGRGRARRHLPHDRIPRAARSLRLLRLLGAARGLRHPARRVPRAIPWLGPADRRRAWSLRGLDRSRLGAARLPPRQAGARSRREPRGRVRTRLLGEPARGEVRPAGEPAGQQAARRARDRALAGSGDDRAGPAAPARPLGRTARDLPGLDTRPRHRPHGQHVECVPVHDHLRHEPLRLVLRVGHRAGDGLSRFQPGSAGLRPHGARAGARADRRHRLDADGRRRRVSPVSAADKAGQQRHRLGLQRRSTVAHHRGRGVPEGDRGRVDPRRGGAV